MRKRKFAHGLIFVAVFAAAIAVVMLLWNALIPAIIGWGSMNYLQAAGLMILCRLLFGGFGKGHHGWGRARHSHDQHEHFHKLREGMKGMSHEERKEFIRERMKYSFGDRCNKNNSSEDKEEQYERRE